MRTATRPIEVYYDGRCGTCRKGARRLERLDWTGALNVVDFHSVPPESRPVTEAVFDTGMPVRTRDGRLLVGFPGLRHALIHTPLGWALGWTLYVPGVSHAAAAAYRRFARNRPREACAIAGES